MQAKIGRYNTVERKWAWALVSTTPEITVEAAFLKTPEAKTRWLNQLPPIATVAGRKTFTEAPDEWIQAASVRNYTYFRVIIEP